MSFQAMAWAIKQPVPDPLAKLLLLVLANYADDKNRAWPSQATLVADTGMSERSIRNKIDVLVEAGHLAVTVQKHAAGTRNIYHMAPAQDAGGDRSQVPEAPAPRAADPIKEPINTTPKRTSRITDDWQPKPGTRDWALLAFPNLEIDHEISGFRDHFLGKGEARLDWDASFRNWCRKSAEYRRPGRLVSGPGAGRTADNDRRLRDFLGDGDHPEPRPILGIGRA